MRYRLRLRKISTRGRGMWELALLCDNRSLFYARCEDFDGALWMIRTSVDTGVFMGYPSAVVWKEGRRVHQ